ncbi:MAG TPA: serine hydrolase [Rhizomicrobium sp.]|nr:serine hydrolase [Rhizomicrobium sp.]
MFAAKAVLAIALTLSFVMPSFAAGTDPVFGTVDANAPGCAAGAMRGGKIVFSGAYGLADMNHRTPLTTASLFNMASVSKQFTAFTVLQLEQEGLLKLSDPVRKYIPELGAFANDITLYQLLTHTGGIRDFVAMGEIAGTSPETSMTEQAFMDVMARQTAGDFVPGTSFVYGNSDYVLLSLVVKRVSGQNLNAAAHKRIFAPLGMKHSTFRHDHHTVIPGMATGYAMKDGAWQAANDGQDVVGGSGLYSSIDEMLLWAKNFHQPVIGAKALTTMQARGTLSNGQQTGYGMGLAPLPYRGLKVIVHNGSLKGYRSSFQVFPDQDFAAIVLCNSGSASPEQIVSRLADTYLADQFAGAAANAAGGAPQSAPAPKSAPTSAMLDAYVGDYVRDNGYGISITRKGDQLVSRATGLAEFPLTTLSQNSFLFDATATHYNFAAPGADGHAASLEVVSPSRHSVLTRIALPPLGQAEMDGYAGHYVSAELGAAIDIVVRDGVLVLHAPTQEKKLLRIAPDAFSADYPFGSVQFARDGARITGFVVNGAIKNMRFDKASAP